MRDEKTTISMRLEAWLAAVLIVLMAALFVSVPASSFRLGCSGHTSFVCDLLVPSTERPSALAQPQQSRIVPAAYRGNGT